MNRVVQMWNKLPDEVVQASTISVLKARLDSYLVRSVSNKMGTKQTKAPIFFVGLF